MNDNLRSAWKPQPTFWRSLELRLGAGHQRLDGKPQLLLEAELRFPIFYKFLQNARGELFVPLIFSRGNGSREIVIARDETAETTATDARRDLALGSGFLFRIPLTTWLAAESGILIFLKRVSSPCDSTHFSPEDLEALDDQGGEEAPRGGTSARDLDTETRSCGYMVKYPIGTPTFVARDSNKPAFSLAVPLRLEWRPFKYLSAMAEGRWYAVDAVELEPASSIDNPVSRITHTGFAATGSVIVHFDHVKASFVRVELGSVSIAAIEEGQEANPQAPFSKLNDSANKYYVNILFEIPGGSRVDLAAFKTWSKTATPGKHEIKVIAELREGSNSPIYEDFKTIAFTVKTRAIVGPTITIKQFDLPAIEKDGEAAPVVALKPENAPAGSTESYVFSVQGGPSDMDVVGFKSWSRTAPPGTHQVRLVARLMASDGTTELAKKAEQTKAFEVKEKELTPAETEAMDRLGFSEGDI